jgi:glycine/D-amino acid oxidase-like deaminating enzyme/nitrite reductase/ring-hydroxylating ferredoxin subunit
MTLRSEPIWRRNAPDLPSLVPLNEDDDAAIDVLVIGAGIAGLSVALALLESGRDVTVIEKSAIGAGETERSSAHLAAALDDRFHRLERMHGEDGAREAARSHRDAIDRIERWIAQYGIDCSFARIDGYLVGADDRGEAELSRELDAALRAGLDVEVVDAVPGLARFGPALRFGEQARFDPLAYVAGLARAAAERGARLALAEAVAVEGGAPPRVQLANGTWLAARAVVVATNVPFHERIPVHTEQAAYRTYVLATPIESDVFPDVLLWDTADPYHYVRRWRERDGTTWLIVGGADHRTGQSKSRRPFRALAAWTRDCIGAGGDIEWRWSGQIIEPVDGLASIGRDAGGEENVYVVTGDSGNGLTHGTIAASVIAALILGREDPYGGLYDPRRSRLRAMNQWLAENANVAAQYRDWLAAGRLRALAYDDATIVRNGLHRIAVYRGVDGGLRAFSAQCPHLGGSVRWNAVERSWDCPCHGSRFDPIDGHVLNGPAAHGLMPLRRVR